MPAPWDQLALDGDTFALGVGALGQLQLEDAVDVFSFNLFEVGTVGELDGTVQSSTRESVVLVVTFGLALLFGMDGKQVADDLNVEVGGIKAWSFGADDVLIVFVFDIQAPAAVSFSLWEWGKVAEEALEKRIEFAAELLQRMAAFGLSELVASVCGIETKHRVPPFDSLFVD